MGLVIAKSLSTLLEQIILGMVKKIREYFGFPKVFFSQIPGHSWKSRGIEPLPTFVEENVH